MTKSMTTTIQLSLTASVLGLMTPVASQQQHRVPVIPNPRIIGGVSPPQSRYPYTVSLTYFGAHFCGGSLIAPDIVLSAAHCAGYSSSVEVGRFDRSKGTLIDENILDLLLKSSDDGVVNLMDEEYYESIDVKYEIKHPAFDSKTVDNDFLLLKLAKVSMIPSPPLAKLNVDPEIPDKPGQELLTMGWGDTDPDPNVNTPSNLLLSATLNYVSNEECRMAEGVVQDEEQGPMSVSFRPMITVSSWHTLWLMQVANQSLTHSGFIITLSYHLFFFCTGKHDVRSRQARRNR